MVTQPRALVPAAGVDLHVHSLASDGALSPESIVEEAARRKIPAIAVTDHETVAAVEPAVRRGLALGVEVVPGVELPASEEGIDGLSLLGLFIDPSRWQTVATGPSPAPVVVALDSARPGRAAAHRRLLAARPDDDRCRHAARQVLPAARAIRAIREARGVAVLAAPERLERGGRRLLAGELEAIVARLAADGLEAVEHPIRPLPGLATTARRAGLVVLPGSGFHGRDGDETLGTSDRRRSLAQLADLRKRFLSRRPFLFVLSGLPGTGKSRVSEALTALTGQPAACLDELRERHFPLAKVGRDFKYSPHVTGILYGLAQEMARSSLATSTAAILDGTFLMRPGRAEAAAIAQAVGGETLFVKVTAPEEVVLERLGRRVPGEDHKSEAGVDIYRMMQGKLTSGESGYSDLETDAACGQCPGGLVVVDTHRSAVRVVTANRLALAVAHGLMTLGFSMEIGR